jgi:hypothetical protein
MFSWLRQVAQAEAAAFQQAAQAEAYRQQAERSYLQERSVSFVLRDGIWELPDVRR